MSGDKFKVLYDASDDLAGLKRVGAQFRDDDGNSIVVKKEELKLMGDAVTTINEDQQLLNG